MNKKEIEMFARKQMNEHGFHHVPITWDRARRRLGCVMFKRGTGEPTKMSLSSVILPEVPDDLARDVVLHEVAHLIAGPHNGHNAKWRKACLLVGARPERTTDAVPDSVRIRHASVVLVCQKCGKEIAMYRRPKHDPSRYMHTGCGGKFTW